MIGLIPAGGKGSRLKELTTDIPKPLIMIGNRTLLENTIRNLESVGATKFVIGVRHKKEQIKKYLETLNVNAVVVEDKESPDNKCGLPWAIISAKEYLKERFIMHLPDNIFTENYKYLVDLHERERPLVTLVIAQNMARENWAEPVFKGNELIDIVPAKAGIRWTLTGLTIHEPEYISYFEKIKPIKRLELENFQAIKLALEDGQKICVVPLKGKRIDITDKDDYTKFKDFEYLW